MVSFPYHSHYWGPCKIPLLGAVNDLHAHLCSKESLAERFCGALAALAPASTDCGATGAETWCHISRDKDGWGPLTYMYYHGIFIVFSRGS